MGGDCLFSDIDELVDHDCLNVHFHNKPYSVQLGLLSSAVVNEVLIWDVMSIHKIMLAAFYLTGSGLICS